MGNDITEVKEKIVKISRLRTSSKLAKKGAYSKLLRTVIDGGLIALASAAVGSNILKVILLIGLGLRAGWNTLATIICGLASYACNECADELEKDILDENIVVIDSDEHRVR